MQWPKSLKNKVRRDVSLKTRTTFNIGGAAKYFICPSNIADLREVLACCKRNRLPVFVLGKGSNILVSDAGVKGAVIALDAPLFTKIRRDGKLLIVGAGGTLARVLAYCIRHGLAGMEFLAGIPGSVGGALAMNAGIAMKNGQRCIGDLVESVLVMDYNNRIKLLQKQDICFGYRTSSLSHYIIVGATLRLRRDSGAAVRKRIARYLRLRRADRQWKFPNAGCVFKNPSSGSAGRLIDGCGLKGTRAGKAEISQDHANFILNTGGARSRDVLLLMRHIRLRVKKKFGVVLEPEIKIWQ